MHSIAIAGSTHHTLLCAQSLIQNADFRVTAILTPAPKPQGRKQILTPNPMHAFALAHQLPLILIEKKIDQDIQTKIASLETPEILLVVDFGFLVPSWLLRWPRVAPLNIHPSDLPKYRGSSPGQFTLMSGETSAAVCVIIMDEKLDHGPVVAKLHFDIGDKWTSKDYYERAFTLIGQNLAQIILDFIASPHSQPQPDESPTSIAHKLKREDGYVSNDAILNDPFTIFNKWRGLSPWPGLWTIVNLHGKPTRMKIIEAALENGKFVIKQVQYEGKKPQAFDS